MTELLKNNFGSILLIVSMVFMFVIWVMLYIGIKNYFTLKNRYEDFKDLNERLRRENEDLSKKQSEDLLPYLQNVTMQITIIKFREYIDSHDMSMITRENIKRLASDICVEVNNVIRKDKLEEMANDTLLTNEFYNIFIIHTCINSVKRLVEQEIENISNKQ